MFNLPQPSMALNSHDVPPPDYKMYNTYKVDAGTSPEHMMSWSAKVADGVSGGLRCLVINCHGKPGRLCIGSHITPSNTDAFNALKGKVNTIFIVACRIAVSADSNTPNCNPGICFDGNLFCADIAKKSGATVFCADEYQSTYAYTVIGLPFGCIDEFEGNVFEYSPSDGSRKQVSNDYVSKKVRNLRLGL